MDQSGQVLEEMGLEEDRLSARGESTHIGKYSSSCDGGRAWAFSGLSSKVYHRSGWGPVLVHGLAFGGHSVCFLLNE